MAFSPDRQTLLTVRAGTVAGHAAPDRGLPGRDLSSPGLEHVAHDHVLDRAGVGPGPLQGGRMAHPPRSAAGSEASAPPNRPMGVLAPAQITGWVRSNMVVPPSPALVPSLPSGTVTPGRQPGAFRDPDGIALEFFAPPS